MAIDGINNKGDLRRFIDQEVRRQPPVAPAALAPVASDPDAPSDGAILYCIADNGSGKREVRLRFPTGVVQVVGTEP